MRGQAPAKTTENMGAFFPHGFPQLRGVLFKDRGALSKLKRFAPP